MPDGQRSVGGHISCTKARTAESRAHRCAAGHQLTNDPRAHQLHHNGLAAGVYAEGIISTAAGMTFEDGIGLVDAVEQAAGAACNDPLIHPQPAIFDLAAQIQLYVLSAHQLLHVLLALVQDILQVGVQLLNGECVGRVHRQGDHGADTRQIHRDQTIVIGQLCRSQGLIILLSAMCSQETAGGLVCFPNRGQAGGLGGHRINGIAGILP